MNIYAIRNISTKELATFDGKHCWEHVQDAARSYNQGTRKWMYTGKKPRKDNGWEWHQRHFADQEEYEIVQIGQFVAHSNVVCKASKVRKIKIVEFEMGLGER